jgi:ATP-dependent helicase/nuclease subunit A
MTINNSVQSQGSDPKLSAFVMASAGTGKTKMLVDRIFRLLIQGIPLSSILCVTFTKAAAHEMRIRLFALFEKTFHMNDMELQNFLHDFGEDLPQSDLSFVRSIYFDLLNEQHALKIQTIHSFCQNFLQTNAIYTKLIPPFHILDDLKKKELILKSLSSVCAKNDHKKAFDFLTARMSMTHFLDMLFDAISLKYEDIEKSLHFNLPITQHVTEQDILRLIDDLPEPIRKDIPHKEIFSFFLTKTGSPKKRILKKDVLKKFDGLEEAVNDIATLCHIYKDNAKTTHCLNLNQHFFAVAQSVKENYDHLKQQHSSFDFDDLILETCRLLELPESGAIHQRLGYTIQAILIDEAQDTSPLQWDLLMHLIENMLLSETEKSSLLVVGDLKQSIYSFQGADPSIFLEKREAMQKLFLHYQKNLHIFSLEKSYRCAKKILTTVDDFFNKHPDGLFLENHLHHEQHREDDGVVHILPIINIIQPEEEGEKDADDEDIKAYDLLAENIANLIEKLVVQKGYQPRDILLLFRNRHEFIGKIDNILTHKKIPTSGSDRFLLNNHPLVGDFLNFIQWCLSKDDDYVFIHLSKSVFYSFQGIDEISLYNHVQKKEDHSLWAYLSMAPVDIQDTLSHFINFLKKYISKIGYEPLAHILNQIWHEKSILFFQKYGQEAQEIFEILHATIYDLENKLSLSPQEIIWHLKTEDIEIKKDLASKEFDQVQMMTIHGSKGLESPIVILADANLKPTIQKEKLILFENLHILKPSDDTCPSSLMGYKEKALSDLKLEEQRLLYVALTRARDALFIFGKGKRVEHSWHNRLEENQPHDALHNDINDNKVMHQNTPYSVVTIPDYFSEPVSKTLLVQAEIIKNAAAIRRGICIHELLEFLPGVTVENQKQFCQNFFKKHADIFENENTDKILHLVNHPDYAHLFPKHALNEVSISYNGDIYRVDRLIINDKTAIIVDFKTGLRTENKKINYFKKMKVYKNAFQQHYPDHLFKMCILWIDEWAIDER